MLQREWLNLCCGEDFVYARTMALLTVQSLKGVPISKNNALQSTPIWRLTDRKFAAQIPARIPYRVDLDMSLGPCGLDVTFRSEFWGIKGSLSVGSAMMVDRVSNRRYGREEESCETSSHNPATPPISKQFRRAALSQPGCRSRK